MLQDIAPHKIYNEYRPDAVPSDDSFVLIFKNADVLAALTDSVSFPTVRELDGALRKRLQYLFSVDNEEFYLLPSSDEEPDPAGLLSNPGKTPGVSTPAADYEFTNIRNLMRKVNGPKYRVHAAFTGKHLADWYRDTRFCGRCGSKTVHSEKERACVCPDCGYTMYPRIMPAVIVGVVNNDRILITKYNRGYAHSALIAGFTEIGETLEETVAREVMEEAGLKVKNIRYYKSQPWGIANDLLAGFYCDVDGDTTVHMDDRELKYAEWLTADEIEFQPDNTSLTGEMMKKFAKDHGRKVSFE